MEYQKFIGDKFMKPHFAFIIGIILLYGCSRRDNGQATPSSSEANVQTKSHQPGEGNPKGENPDSLRPVHVYTFNYADPSFPCEPEGGAMIKGFDTDGKGRLYIAGGKPIRLACYNGQHKEYDIVITTSRCNNAIMTLYEDSVMFVEEESQSIAVISKDGKGDVLHYNLPLKETDSIMSGVFRGKDLELEVHDNSVEIHNHEEFKKNTHVYLLSSLNSWGEKEVSDDAASFPNSRDFLSDEAKEKLEYYSYKGLYHDMHVFYRHELFLGDIALVDKTGHIRAEASLAQVPPIHTCCGEDEHIGWYNSANLYRVKGYSFFLSAYDGDEETISFLEYDLKPLYDFVH